MCGKRSEEFSRRSEKSTALAKDLKNSRRYSKSVNDSFQDFYSSASIGLPIDTSAFNRKNYTLRSFVEHYLLIPSFPEDVAQALDSGEINLFEAEQLARLTHSRTGIPEEKMKKRRREMLRTHLQLGESGARLKARVDALLYYYRHPEAIFQPAPETPQYSPEILAAAKQLEAEIESLHDASESSIAGISPDHFFYEYLQLITSYIPEIRPDEMSDAEMDRLMTLAEQLIHLLHSIHKRQNAPADEKTMEETKKAFHM